MHTRCCPTRRSEKSTIRAVNKRSRRAAAAVEAVGSIRLWTCSICFSVVIRLDAGEAVLEALDAQRTWCTS